MISFVCRHFSYDFQQAVEWLAQRMLAAPAPPTRRIKEIYDYQNEKRATQHQTIRYEPKGFSQRRPDGDGHWVWGLSAGEYWQNQRGDWYKCQAGKTGRLWPAAETVLYRLPELIAADPRETIWIVEGEKDVETLRAKRLSATCNPMGAGAWKESYNNYLKNRRVVIIPDQDQNGAGQKHARDVWQNVKSEAAEAHICQLPKGKDTTEFFELGGTRDEFLNLPVAEDAPAVVGNMSVLIQALMTELDEYQSGKIIDLPLPWPELNATFYGRGIPPKTLGLLSSRMGVGKSFFILNLALCVAGYQRDKQYPVFILNTEMTYSKIIRRVFASLSRDSSLTVSHDKKKMENLEFEFAESLARLPIHFTDAGTMAIAEAVQIIEQQAPRHKLIIVDHIGGLKTEQKRFEALPELAAKLQSIAQREGMVIFLATHLKTGEDRDIMAYSREIENVADISWSLTRSINSDVCLVKSCYGGEQERMVNLILNVRKNRDAISDVKIGFWFDGDTLQLSDAGRVIKIIPNKKNQVKYDL